MKLCFIVAVVFCSAFAAGVASGEPSLPDSLTLDEVVGLALSEHPAVVRAEHGVTAAEARVGTSRSIYYPDVYLTGIYNRIGPVPTIDIPDRGAMQLYPENNYDIHFGLRQALYDFGRNATSVELARSGVQTAEHYVEQVKSDIAYRTISVFNSILILRRSVAVLDEQIEALSRHLEISRKKVQAGTATDFDVLTTQVRIAAAKDDRIDAAEVLETQQILLRRLTGLPPERPIVLKGDFAGSPTPPDPEFLLRDALRQRPEMAIARDAETSAAIQVRLNGLADRPALALNVTSGLKTGYVPDLNVLEPNFSAGIQLRFPIFNGHRTRYQQLEAKASLHSAVARTEDLKRRVAAEVEQAVADARAAVEKIENAEVLVNQANEAVRMAKAKYEAGVVTNLDLLDAQTTLTQAKLNRLRALYNYEVSRIALDKAAGVKVWEAKGEE